MGYWWSSYKIYNQRLADGCLDDDDDDDDCLLDELAIQTKRWEKGSLMVEGRIGDKDDECRDSGRILAENSPQRGTGTYLKADMLYIVETWGFSPEY